MLTLRSAVIALVFFVNSLALYGLERFLYATLKGATIFSADLGMPIEVYFGIPFLISLNLALILRQLFIMFGE